MTHSTFGNKPQTKPHGAGLPAASVVRMKLFTLDHRFIIAKRGQLSEKDQRATSRALKSALEL